MLCQFCHNNQATVFITRMVDGNKVESSLCADCAEKEGHLQDFQEPFSFHEFVWGMMNGKKKTISASEAVHQEFTCSSCGLSLGQFAKSGKFGCENCYQAFASQLPVILKNFQGGHFLHNGRKPPQFQTKEAPVDPVTALTQELAEMKIRLQNHILAERFEQAASARDQIKVIENQIREATSHGE